MSTEERDTRMYLHAYLDGELSPEDSRWFESRLRQDPALRRALEQERQFRALFRAHVQSTHAPATLQARVQELLVSPRQEAQPPARLSWWAKVRTWWQTPPRAPRWALALYTVLVILLAGSGAWLAQGLLPGQETHTVFRKLAGKHNVYVEPSPVLDVTGTPEEVAAWFQARAPWPVSVPTLAGWQLVGGRLGEFHHQPTVHLLYRQDSRYISLILFAARDSDFPAQARRQVDGADVYVDTAWERPVVLWRDGEIGYALIGDVGQSQDELLALVSTLLP